MLPATWQALSAVLDLLHAEFTSAPNLTAEAAAQNLTWAPVSVSAVTVDSYDLAMNTSDSALLTLSLSASLGVSGDISDIAPDASTSRRRRLLQTASGLFAPFVVLGSAACYRLHQVCLHLVLSRVLPLVTHCIRSVCIPCCLGS